MNKVILNIAKRSIKENKSKYLFLAIFVSTLFLGTFNLIRDSFSYTDLLEDYYNYGKHDFIIKNIDYGNDIIADPFIVQYNIVERYNNILDKNNKIIGDIGYIDIQSGLLLPIHLINGKMPERNNEIALEKNVLEQLNYDPILNQTINITGTSSSKEYKLVGILENQNNQMPVKSVNGIVIKEDSYLSKDIFFKTDHQYLPKTIPINQLIYNNSIRPMGSIINIISNTITITTFFISAILIFNAIMSVCYAKTNELRLLRAIGATQNQCTMTIFYQVIFLSILGLIFGLIFSVIMSFGFIQGYGYYVNKEMSFMINLQSVILVIIVICLSIIIACVYPIGSIYKLNLVGDLKQQRSKVKIKKIKQLLPFRITLRHLKISAKKTISIIIILAICLTVFNESVCELIKSKNIEVQEKVDFYYERGVSFSNENLENEVNLKHFLEENESNINYQINKTYYIEGDVDLFGYKNEYSSNDSFISIYTVDHINQEFKNAIENILDNQYTYEDFEEGRVAIINLPYAYEINDQDNQKSYQYDNKQKILDQNKRNVIHNSQINIGDVISYNENQITIGGIIDDYSVIKVINQYLRHDNFIDPYDLITSTKMELNHIDFRTTYYFNTDYSNIDKIQEISNCNASFYKFDQAEDLLIKNDFKQIQISIFALFFALIILLQQLTLRIQTRTKEIGTYKSLGMENSQIIRIYLYEGLIISLMCICVPIIYRLISLNQDINLFPWKTYVLILVLFVITVLLIYYYPIKKMIRKNIIESIKYKE